MINILFVTESLAHNGTETFIMNVYRCLNPTKFHVDFLLYKDVKSDYSEEVKNKGSVLYFVPSRKKAPIKSYKSLNLFFKEHQGFYKVVHFCCGSLTSIAPIVYAHKYNVPVRIIHSHNSNCTGIHNKVFHRLLKSIANGIATNHLACSDKAASFFKSKDVNYYVIKNGINLEEYDFNFIKRGKTRKELGLNNNFVIGHVGRFTAVKNHSFIIDIFKECVNLNENMRLLLIGDGELENDIRRKVNQLNISDKVIFMGKRIDVADLLRAMDCFLMPSLFEGFPFVLVEAQASALPCIVSDVIDKKVDLTGAVHFMSLENSSQKWAKSIMSICEGYHRSSQIEQLRYAGYDIVETTKILEEIYNQ